MINHSKSIRIIRKRHYALFLIILLSSLFYTGCDKSDTNGPGLTVSNLCFDITGGNTSNELIADESWSISIPGNNPWLSVNPSSGQASSSPINLIFIGLPNNNPQSRSTEVIITIGSKSYSYQAQQDGTEDPVCIN